MNINKIIDLMKNCGNCDDYHRRNLLKRAPNCFTCENWNNWKNKEVEKELICEKAVKYYEKLIQELDSFPFSLKSSLELLIKAAIILLDDKSYDGTHHEEILYCVRNLEEKMKQAEKELKE